LKSFGFNHSKKPKKRGAFPAGLGQEAGAPIHKKNRPFGAVEASWKPGETRKNNICNRFPGRGGDSKKKNNPAHRDLNLGLCNMTKKKRSTTEKKAATAEAAQEKLNNSGICFQTNQGSYRQVKCKLTKGGTGKKWSN